MINPNNESQTEMYQRILTSNFGPKSGPILPDQSELYKHITDGVAEKMKRKPKEATVVMAAPHGTIYPGTRRSKRQKVMDVCLNAYYENQGLAIKMLRAASEKIHKKATEEAYE